MLNSRIHYTVSHVLSKVVNIDLFHLIDHKHSNHPRTYLRGGGGSNHPPKFSDFFLKSEGKEIERKRKKKECRGGGYLLTYFEFFTRGWDFSGRDEI